VNYSVRSNSPCSYCLNLCRFPDDPVHAYEFLFDAFSTALRKVKISMNDDGCSLFFKVHFIYSMCPEGLRKIKENPDKDNRWLKRVSNPVRNVLDCSCKATRYTVSGINILFLIS
jgi:hypothetical protein